MKELIKKQHFVVIRGYLENATIFSHGGYDGCIQTAQKLKDKYPEEKTFIAMIVDEIR